MAKAELGEKQTCPNCGAKFYDLRKRPAVCPKCATAFDPAEETTRLKRVRSRNPNFERTYEEEPAEAVAAEEDEEEEVEETPELDAEGAEAVVLEDDDEDAGPSGDELPAGFSEEEADLEDDETTGDDVPLLEDEEDFDEDELGTLPDKDDET